MALFPEDQFYLQRSRGGTKDYDKMKVSLEELETHILGGYNDQVDDVNDRIDQEIIDRIEGDENLKGQVDGLTDRMRVISNELYDTVVQNEYEYKFNTDQFENYRILVKNECATLPLFEQAICRQQKLDVYGQGLAGDGDADTRGGFYLASLNYDYERTEGVLLSDTTKNGTRLDLSTITLGSLIEVINIIQTDAGTDGIDNYNYGFYRITKIGGVFEETNGIADAGGPSHLHVFGVDYVGSSGGPPSIQVGDNRFLVKVVLDLVSTLNDVYVNKTGDEMSGPLEINVLSNIVPNNPLNQPGLATVNNITGAALTLTGFPLTTDNPTTINITNEKETEIKFATKEDTRFYFKGPWMVVDDDEAKGTQNVILKYNQYVDAADSGTGNPITEFIEVDPEVIFTKKVEYLHAPNLTSGVDLGNQNIIPPRAYVDEMDRILENMILDVSQRIDTLARASDIYQYRLLLPGDVNDCTEDLDSGQQLNYNPNGAIPPPFMPSYDPANPGDYDKDDVANAQIWAECIRYQILQLVAAGDPPAGMFDMRTFVEEYNDISTGATGTRDTDYLVIHNETNLLTAEAESIALDWSVALKVGDYLEVSPSDGRTSAYVIYVVESIDNSETSVVIVKGQIMYKANVEFLAGQNYKIKFYEKAGGLTIDDLEPLFVNKQGDTIYGQQTWSMNAGNGIDPIRYIDLGDSKEYFKVGPNGEVKGLELTLQDGDSDPTFTFTRAEIFTDCGNQPLNIINKSVNHFVLRTETKEEFVVTVDKVDVKNKKIENLKDPSNPQDAVTLSYLLGTGSNANVFLRSSDSSIDILPDNATIDLKVGEIDLNRLSDVVIDYNKLDHQRALLYNAYNKQWEVSDTKIASFTPGDRVAYSGQYPETEVEVGGLFMNPEQGTLSIRIQ